MDDSEQPVQEEMSQEDREFWEDLIELTGRPQWNTLMEEVERHRENLENRLFWPESWENFHEIRGEYRAWNFMRNLRPWAKSQLGMNVDDE